jgi:hypothetical protein
MVPIPLLLTLFSVAILVASVACLVQWLGPRLSSPHFAIVAASGTLIALALILMIAGAAQAVWVFVVLLAIGGLLVI